MENTISITTGCYGICNEIKMREKHENYISTCFKKSKITILAELLVYSLKV
jgi:hypothetical protein